MAVVETEQQVKAVDDVIQSCFVFIFVKIFVPMEKDKSCKTPRWRMLKSQLNNLSAQEFITVSGQSYM